MERDLQDRMYNLSIERQALIREQLAIIASIKATSRQMRKHNEASMSHGLPSKRFLLLQMTESLVQAHKVAKIDDDGMTLDVIEDALRYVGGRLAREYGDGRNFLRKRVGSL